MWDDGYDDEGDYHGCVVLWWDIFYACVCVCVLRGFFAELFSCIFFVFP